MGVAGVVLLGVAAYQLVKGVRQKFLDELKTEQMSPGMETWITWIGTVGHVARAVVFGLVGWFLLKAAYEYDANEAVGLDGALTKILKAEYGPWLLGRRRRGSRRLRRLLDQRSPVPQDLGRRGPGSARGHPVHVTSRAGALWWRGEPKEGGDVLLGGVDVDDRVVRDLAAILDRSLGNKLESALVFRAKIVGLTTEERRRILAALEHAPAGLETVRQVLLTSEAWRLRDRS